MHSFSKGLNSSSNFVLESVRPTRNVVYGGRSICSGDSGGPAVEYPSSESPGQEVLVGIISAGSGCPSTHFTPDVLTRVKYFLPWIRSIASNIRTCKYPVI